MRWILMKHDNGAEWVEYLGSDAEWEFIRASRLHETHEGLTAPEWTTRPRHEGDWLKA